MKILFVCGMNQQRSPTAEKIYQQDPRVQVRSAGLSQSSPRKLSAQDIEWADLILVMERRHKQRIVEDFQSMMNLPPIECLNISAELSYMTPELIDQIRTATEPYIANS